MAISAAAFGAKHKSKRELYRFLTHECGSYLSSYETVTVYHMRDLVGNKRRRIPQTAIKVITIPHFDTLRIEDLLAFAKRHPVVMDALPVVEREILKLPRP